MDIIVKGRHTGVHDRFRDQANTKLAKIGKLDPKVIRVDVEVSKESNLRVADERERVELTIHSRGPVIRAEAAADDRYAALDIAVGRLESRLRRMCERRKDRQRGKVTANTPAMDTATAFAAPDTVADEPPGSAPKQAQKQAPKQATRQKTKPKVRTPAPEPTPVPEARAPEPDTARDGAIVPIDMEGDGPLVVREKAHQAEPMTLDQALFEMELVGHDFYLFRDKEGDRPSVVYRRRGYDYGVIRLIEE